MDVKSIFSTKVIPQEEEPKTIFKSIENGVSSLKKTLKKKGREVVKKMKTEIEKLGHQPKEES